jgi:homoserine kinase
MGHATATFAALTAGDAALLREACVDRLHEPYRKALIRDYDRAQKVALEAGGLAHIISGSGATMLAVCTAEKCDEVATALAAALPHVRLHTLAAADKGAQVVAR